ncbi:MAG TPA: hypothetical protein VJU77_17345 [Chthoniobacterales bacterium]|nr:hypothetical protein [Chthoniobacterales bacterium]
MNEPPHARTPAHIAATLWKLSKSFCPVDQGIAKSICSLGIIFRDMPDDCFEILQRERQEDYFEVH